MTPELDVDADADERLGEIFVELADTLISDFDFLDVAHNLTEFAVELLNIDAAGVSVADKNGLLTLVASSHESARLLELYEQETQEGPCLDSFHTSAPIVNVPLAESTARWPRFSEAARMAGFATVHSVPLKLRNDTIGSLNLFSTSAIELSERDIKLGSALAAIATIAILQERASKEKDVLTGQLKAALKTRIIIEQAKGIMAERNKVGIEVAFQALRRYARAQKSTVAATAGQVIGGTWDAIIAR